MTIKEVSKKYSITQDTLRYYKKTGLIRPVTRKNGIRDYGEKELANIEFVVCMRGAGLPVKVLAKYITLLDQGNSMKEKRLNILKEQHQILNDKIQELQKAVKKLDYKINAIYKDNNL